MNALYIQIMTFFLVQSINFDSYNLIGVDLQQSVWLLRFSFKTELLPRHSNLYECFSLIFLFTNFHERDYRMALKLTLFICYPLQCFLQFECFGRRISFVSFRCDLQCFAVCMQFPCNDRVFLYKVSSASLVISNVCH